MPTTVRDLLLACTAAALLGCGDSGTGEGDGFVVGGRHDGGQDGGAADASMQDASGADAGMDTGTALPDAAPVDSGSDDGPDTGPAVDPCPIYCARALANCTGANALYPDEASCLAGCAPMPPGTEGDTDVNSAWCRAHHADEAPSDPDLHCGIASENGGRVCGSLCDAYCDQILAYCTGDYEEFADRAECMSACAAYPDGEWYDTTGDTVQCRTFQARSAALDDPAFRCPAAGASGFGACF